MINIARSRGHHIITLDNNPDNPGHVFADEYFNISTIDLEGVLRVAKDRQIDGILAYGSDPAAATAAFVSEKLHLPGNSYKSIITLSDKGLFRTFLKDNGFPVPKFSVFERYKGALDFSKTLTKKAFIKPVDSCGSKGITIIEPGEGFKDSFHRALDFSRKGEVIIEEEIDRDGPHIHGEAFVQNGKLLFMMLGDQYFSNVNNCAPMSTTIPSMFHGDIMEEIWLKLDKIIERVGFIRGGLNIEIIRDTQGRVYFIEVGARSGGNFMPEIVTMASGFNIAEANVNTVLEEKVDLRSISATGKYFTQLILHSHCNGIYQGDNLASKFENFIRFKKEYYLRGDRVPVYRDSRHVLGVFLYEFKEKDQCLEFIQYIKSNKLVNVEPEK